jgi:hypothetical protein
MITLPHVNAIGNLVFCVNIRMELIVFDPGLCAIGKIDSKECILELVIENLEPFAIYRFDSCKVVHAGYSGVDKF